MATTPDTLPPPTPLGPPPDLTSKPSISAEINAATRKEHTDLNRLIISRLPLALPPTSKTPFAYTLGLSAFAQIFFAFEAAFTDLATAEAARDQQPEAASSAYHTQELRRWIVSLRPEGLARSEVLARDLEYLRGLHKGKQPVLSQDECAHIKRQVVDQYLAKPHVLVAYTWVMYMAIFSGGRWIRQQLAGAGPEFWSGGVTNTEATGGDEKTAKAGTPGFSFLSFPASSQDGEDIKAEYKTRLAEAERMLTPAEREDVIEAAKTLFEQCIELVLFLDTEVVKQELKKRNFNSILLAGACVAIFAIWYLAIFT